MKVKASRAQWGMTLYQSWALCTCGKTSRLGTLGQCTGQVSHRDKDIGEGWAHSKWDWSYSWPPQESSHIFHWFTQRYSSHQVKSPIRPFLLIPWLLPPPRTVPGSLVSLQQIPIGSSCPQSWLPQICPLQNDPLDSKLTTQLTPLFQADQ
jgi:hypothetical protein